VYSDSGRGIVRGLDTVKPGAGLYYHVCCRANQLTEGVPPQRIVEQLRAFLAKARKGVGANGMGKGKGGSSGSSIASVFVLNVSNADLHTSKQEK
jgi:hypothetical protein